MNGWTVARRTLYRAGLGLRRKKGSWVAGIAAAGALVAYMGMQNGALAGSGVDVAGVQAAGSGDCADVTMAAVAEHTADAAHAAYKCIGRPLSQMVTEDQFVQQITSLGSSGGRSQQTATRVGDYSNRDGSRIVFYVLAGGSQNVGYTLYLGPDGKVWRIE